ncbi:hypothetical protein [Hyalangium minutum]|uniref:Putative pilus biogenesis operon protein n=1 Tax=Hyalangium minutum TaxID=394096 RepID=A0A085WKE0_9BACT|nr:hypothetical protein [Hyalangium minutum]KFE68153.1 putative pilus biogenesis operon protein [Hyalangium minutum]
MRSRRGQAMVETALGLLVFISILVWGIHLAEIGYLMPKVHEAAAGALWDTTAKQMHVHPNNYSKRTSAISSAGGDATSRYGNFDGRTSAGGGTPRLVFTEADGLQVQCQQDNVGGINTSQARLKPYQAGEGGMSCSATAQIRVLDRFPKEFVNEANSGFFKEKNYPNVSGIPVCAIGLPSGGACGSGKIAILLDDWGLSGAPNEKEDCALQGCTNTGFKELVHPMYRQLGGEGPAAGRAMAMAVVQRGPGDDLESRFRLSYMKGPDSGMTGGDSDPANWMTNVRTGSRHSAYADRQEKWLGGVPPP